VLPAKSYKVQGVATLIGTTADIVRRFSDELGMEVARQENGPKTRLYSLDNVFELAAKKAIKKRDKSPKSKQVVATVYAPKGGVGKTTLTGNLGVSFALRGFKVLLVDLDFQANLTLSLGYDSELTMDEADEEKIPASSIVEHHFGHLMKEWPTGRQSLKDVIKKPYGEYGPHLIPADLTLDRLDTIMLVSALEGKPADTAIAALIQAGMSGKDKDFDIRDYDIILFDASPSKSRITKGALLASDYVISPVSMEKFSTKALSYLASVLTEMQEQFSRCPELVIVGNFFDAKRGRVLRQLLNITSAYNNAWIGSTIKRSEDFPKNLNEDMDLPLVLAKPTCNSAVELQSVAEMLLKRMELING